MGETADVTISRGAFLDKCAHSVYCIPRDWEVQAEWRIPASRRIAWYCWWCREYGDDEFSLERLKRLAMANCQNLTAQKIREADTVPEQDGLLDAA